MKLEKEVGIRVQSLRLLVKKNVIYVIGVES